MSGIVLVLSGVLFAQALFRKPVKVLGDPEFVGTASNPLAFQSIGPNWVDGRELNSPSGVALDNSVSPPILYIADSGNNRVLGYRYTTQVVAGSVADIVIGQVDRFSNQAQNPASGGRSTGLNNPTGLAVDKTGNLYVADTGNNRILRYPQPFSSANQFPTLVIGQKTLSTSSANLNGIGASTLSIGASGLGRTGIAFDPSGNLWVADTGNSRVLRFPSAVLSTGFNFPLADMVIGQADFVSNGTLGVTRTTKTQIVHPNGISFDTTGRLYVTDQLFRVLEYDSPLSTNQAAARILGVDTTSTIAASPTQVALNGPQGVVGLDTGPIVADTSNNRLMQYPAPSNWKPEATQFSPSALFVSGQTSFTVNKANQGNGDSSAGSFDIPVDLAVAPGELYVVDSFNNRVLVFAQTPTGISGLATRVIGQLDFPYNGGNMLDGKGFAFPSGFQSAAVLDTSVAPLRLYVADTINNRILGFRDFTHLQDGQPADLVIGQPDLFRNLINYPSNDPTLPTASSLYLPTSLALDSAGNLYVADTGNSRILRFPAPYATGQTSPEAADLVLGQRDFTSKVTDATEITMISPAGIALTSDAVNAAVTDKGWLLAADSVHNRVLFFQKPFVSGMSATKVLGQLNFNTTTGNSDPFRFSSPRGVSVDPQDRVIVADTVNKRVQVFDKAANLVNYAAPLVSLANGFNTPLSIAIGPAGDFWVVDNGATTSALQHFPSVPNLPLTNNAADASLPALVPHSGYVDKFNNLIVTDGINRVLYFAPQINLTNAASYSTRPLSAGTLTALFPTIAANPIAGGTATAPAGKFPLPTTLSDTQVTVNATAVPLLFVSPGQINAVLPNGLPAGGTADLQAIRPSTGQIFGGAELSIASASPGLFTLDASGAGPVLAVNFDDGSVNGPDHPVVRGKYVILYGTGVGPVANAPADGAPASGQPAPDFPLVLIASSGTSTNGTGGTTTLPKFIPATVTFSGLAPGFAGLWQINVLIPNDAQSGGAVVIKVFENSIPNLDQNSVLTTTLAVR